MCNEADCTMVAVFRSFYLFFMAIIVISVHIYCWSAVSLFRNCLLQQFKHISRYTIIGGSLLIPHFLYSFLHFIFEEEMQIEDIRQKLSCHSSPFSPWTIVLCWIQSVLGGVVFMPVFKLLHLCTLNPHRNSLVCNCLLKPLSKSA